MVGETNGDDEQLLRGRVYGYAYGYDGPDPGPRLLVMQDLPMAKQALMTKAPGSVLSRFSERAVPAVVDIRRTVSELVCPSPWAVTWRVHSRHGRRIPATGEPPTPVP
ncbi:hypothetical protein ADK54_05375 [Streptomyces sp. WM6378]|nr:hypothetical protein ADK54_05375 [Streptomyces sp. WM6378]